MPDPVGLSVWLASHGTIALLVFARIAGLLLIAPWLTVVAVPLSVRTTLAVAVTLIIAPTQPGAAVGQADGLAELGFALSAEALVGIVLAFGMGLLFAGVQLTGQLVSQVAGLSWTELVDPATGAEIPLLSQFLWLFATVVFMLLGGHREVIDGLLDSFATLAPGQVVVGPQILDSVTDMLAQGFELALCAAAPAIAAGLMTTAIVAIASRVAWPMVSSAVGVSLNAAAVIGILSLSLGGIAMALGDQVDPAIELLMEAWTLRQ
ncbi:MAG TPA: flagellar biosynthetic protein FliR [Pirellulales bacterium]|nr:flagellar biosynthetic protein FliR [Pirellulales bacterium]